MWGNVVRSQRCLLSLRLTLRSSSTALYLAMSRSTASTASTASAEPSSSIEEDTEAASLSLARRRQQQTSKAQLRRDVVSLLDDDDDLPSSSPSSAFSASSQGSRKRPLKEETKQAPNGSAKNSTADDELLAVHLQAEEVARVKRQRISASTASSSSPPSTALPRHSATEQGYHDIAFYRNYIRGVTNDYAVKMGDIIQVRCRLCPTPTLLSFSG